MVITYPIFLKRKTRRRHKVFTKKKHVSYITKCIKISIKKQLLKDINEFTNSNLKKLRCFTKLAHTIQICENSIQPEIINIIKTCARFQQHEDLEIQAQVTKVSRLVGAYINSDIYIPLLIGLVADEESKNSIKFLISLLVIFSVMLKSENTQTLEPHLENIIKCLYTLENAHPDNEEILHSLYLIDVQTINNAGENVAIYCRQLFSILLTVQATTKFGQKNLESIEQAMFSLAKQCGYPSIAELHSNEVSILLDEFTKEKTYLQWNKYSKDRFKFDVIVRNCKEGVGKFMLTVLEIL